MAIGVIGKEAVQVTALWPSTPHRQHSPTKTEPGADAPRRVVEVDLATPGCGLSRKLPPVPPAAPDDRPTANKER